MNCDGFRCLKLVDFLKFVVCRMTITPTFERNRCALNLLNYECEMHQNELFFAKSR